MERIEIINSQIQKHFNDLIQAYKMSFKPMDFYECLLLNKHVTIIFSFDRHYDDFQIFILNNKTNIKTGLINILISKKLMGVKVLDEEESSNKKKIQDDLEKNIYGFSIILSKYCSDILSGDFSIMDSHI